MLGDHPCRIALEYRNLSLGSADCHLASRLTYSDVAQEDHIIDLNTGKNALIIIEVFHFETTRPRRAVKIRVFDGEGDAF